MKIVAIIVAFDRKHDVLSTAASLQGVVDQVIVVDNAPVGTARLTGYPNIIDNANAGGLAGAYNRAIRRIQEQSPDTTHVLFLDDDTDTSSLQAFLADQVTRQTALDARFAAVAPAYVDARTGLRGMHAQLDRFRLRMVDRMVEDPTPVTFIINSMSLWRIETFAKIGWYSEALAVDHIDTEYCLRVKEAGLLILLNPRVEYRHTIGERRAYRFLGRQMQAGGHSPSRRRMIGRNTIALGRRFAFRYPAFAVLSLSRVVYEAVGILAVEPDKRRKLLGLARGGFEGIWRNG